MKNHFDSIDQVNNLREIQALRRLSPHAHIILLEEVLYDQPSGRLALVFELMDANLYELIRGRRHYLSAILVHSYMHQLLLALDHMHKKGIFHRDIKPENILIDGGSEGGRGLKLADFGSCRGIYSKQPYTEYISTRWYRAPECLLTDGFYGPEMDLWGAGCVFFEITSLYPLFPGTNELDQIERIHKVLGTPDGDLLKQFQQNGAAHVNFDFAPHIGIGIRHLINHASTSCVELILRMLVHDPAERISAREALSDAYFTHIKDHIEKDPTHVLAELDHLGTQQGLPAIADNTFLPRKSMTIAKRRVRASQSSVKATCQHQNHPINSANNVQATLPPLTNVIRKPRTQSNACETKRPGKKVKSRKSVNQNVTKVKLGTRQQYAKTNGTLAENGSKMMRDLNCKSNQMEFPMGVQLQMSQTGNLPLTDAEQKELHIFRQRQRHHQEQTCTGK
mmetsp:Transcript_5750/g.14884  ORF Transcript_5750/g.14884 Transcript_5750/m.14884 type:complete len:451 (-) Transcript_5750:330-1682(-)